MKCANCGAELKLGCVYCSVCGKEAQIVPDYNILEDDFLKSLLDNEQKEKAEAQKQREEELRKKRELEQEKKRKKKILLFSGIGAMAVLAVILIVVLVVSSGNKKSYTYQYEKGIGYVEEHNYEKAIECFEKASTIEPENVNPFMELSKIYLKQKDYTSAEANLLQVITLEADHEEAYALLIELYNEQEEYDKIAELYKNVEDDSVKYLFEDYLVIEPEFSLNPGVYDDTMEIELSASEGCEIYYTTNGSSPIEKGKKYNEALIFEKEGEYTIRAVAKDERGFYSEIAEAEYELKFIAPDGVDVSPSTGNFTELQLITINVPEGATVYYTWDGTNPTTESDVYSEPLEVPEGNNVLSVLLVDKHGLTTPVMRFNYVYLPEVSEEEEEAAE